MMTSPDHLVLRFSTSEDSLANWASAAIRRLNHSPFSHIDLRLADGNLLGASDQGANSPCIRGNPMGVAVRPPDYQRFGIRRDMVLRVGSDRVAAITAAATTQLGKPFDSTALWDFLADDLPGVRDWRDPDKWFCAELKAWACERGGLFPVDLMWPKNRVSPTDLLLILLTDDRWENRETFWQQVPGLKLDPGER